MRFQFSLEAVLRVARIREECEWSKLQAIQQERAGVCRELDCVQQAQMAVRRDAATQLSLTMPASWLQASDACVHGLKQRERVLHDKLQEVSTRFAAQHKAFIAARRKHEVLSRLKMTRHDAFRRETDRREQIAVDDVFLNRYR